MGVPSVLGNSLCVLRGAALTPKERLCLTYLGGISGLLDDFFDDPKKEANPLKEFIFHPQNLEPQNSNEALLLHFYLSGLELAKDPEKIKMQALEVFEAQEKSLIQNHQNHPAGELDKIIFAKGGSSFIYYRLCLEHPLDKAEEDLLFHLGGLMQLGNDIFDVWEDTKAGISTAATRCKDINEIRQMFSSQLEETFRLARETGYKEKQVKKFLRITGLALSRVYVCLDQFEQLQSSSGNIFKPEKYDRKQLICDMQKISNQLKAIGYYRKMEI